MKYYKFKPNAVTILGNYMSKNPAMQRRIHSAQKFVQKFPEVYHCYDNIHGLNKDWIALNIGKQFLGSCQILVVPAETVQLIRQDNEKYILPVHSLQNAIDYRQWNLMNGFDSVSVFLLMFYSKRTLFMFTGIYRLINRNSVYSSQGTLNGCRLFAKQFLGEDISIILSRKVEMPKKNRNWKLLKVNICET
jgi:hypothetical protein